MAKIKQKRVVLTLKQKKELLDDLDNGHKPSKLAAQYGVAKSTVTSIRKSKLKLVDFISAASTTAVLRKKKMRKPYDERVDLATYLWFTQERSRGTPLSGQFVMGEAMHFDTLFKKDTVSSFKATTGWLHRFKKRHGIRQLKIVGELLSANDQEVAPFQEKLRNLMDKENLSNEQVYNADETGIFWRLLPDKTLAAENEKRAPGYKVSKERITILACSNASGSHKLETLCIGKAKVPHCFRRIPNYEDLIPVNYCSQPSAWMDADLFSSWFFDDFVPAVKDHLQKVNLPGKAVLLVDNAPSHPNDESLQTQDGAIKCMFLPKNMTSRLQPLDQGVLQALKRGYKKKLVMRILASQTPQQSIVEALKSINLWHVVHFIDSAWNDVSSVIIQKSWNRSLFMQSNEQVVIEEPDNDDSDPDLTSIMKGLNLNDKELKQWMADGDDGHGLMSDIEIVAVVNARLGYPDEALNSHPSRHDDGNDQDAAVSVYEVDTSDEESDAISPMPALEVPSHEEAVTIFEKGLMWLEYCPAATDGDEEEDARDMMLLKRLIERATKKKLQTLQQQ